MGFLPFLGVISHTCIIPFYHSSPTPPSFTLPPMQLSSHQIPHFMELKARITCTVSGTHFVKPLSDHTLRDNRAKKQNRQHNQTRHGTWGAHVKESIR